MAPPAIRLTPATRWVLLRAFGPPAAAATEGRTRTGPASDSGFDPRLELGLDPGAAFERAERLALTVRIASRAGTSTLEAELGAELARRFRNARRAAAARDAQLEALAAAVAEVAAEVEIPLALLKYGALRAAGALPPAGRLAADLDLLVRPDDAATLHDALLARGWRSSELPAWEHHLSALEHPGLGAVEVHDRLPGLAPPGAEGSAGGGVVYDDLAARGALEPGEWPGGPPGASADGGLAGADGRSEPLQVILVPARPVLLAHALVHGLVQHGRDPRSYPPWRGVSDWIDLGLGGADGAALLAAATPWLGGALPAADAEAARRLCVLLVEGCPEALIEGRADDDADGARASALGRHLLAGPLDPAYRRSLRLGRWHAAPGAGVRHSGRAGGGRGERPATLRSLAGTLGRALLPPRAELAALYGPWRSRWGLCWRRLVRPADLALRAVTAVASRLRGRWRRPVRL